MKKISLKWLLIAFFLPNIVFAGELYRHKNIEDFTFYDNTPYIKRYIIDGSRYLAEDILPEIDAILCRGEEKGVDRILELLIMLEIRKLELAYFINKGKMVKIGESIIMPEGGRFRLITPSKDGTYLSTVGFSDTDLDSVLNDVCKKEEYCLRVYEALCLLRYTQGLSDDDKKRLTELAKSPQLYFPEELSSAAKAYLILEYLEKNFDIKDERSKEYFGRWVGNISPSYGQYLERMKDLEERIVLTDEERIALTHEKSIVLIDFLKRALGYPHPQLLPFLARASTTDLREPETKERVGGVLNKVFTPPWEKLDRVCRAFYRPMISLAIALGIDTSFAADNDDMELARTRVKIKEGSLDESILRSAIEFGDEISILPYLNNVNWDPHRIIFALMKYSKNPGILNNLTALYFAEGGNTYTISENGAEYPDILGQAIGAILERCQRYNIPVDDYLKKLAEYFHPGQGSATLTKAMRLIEYAKAGLSNLSHGEGVEALKKALINTADSKKEYYRIFKPSVEVEITIPDNFFYGRAKEAIGNMINSRGHIIYYDSKTATIKACIDYDFLSKLQGEVFHCLKNCYPHLVNDYLFNRIKVTPVREITGFLNLKVKDLISTDNGNISTDRNSLLDRAGWNPELASILLQLKDPEAIEFLYTLAAGPIWRWRPEKWEYLVHETDLREGALKAFFLGGSHVQQGKEERYTDSFYNRVFAESLLKRQTRNILFDKDRELFKDSPLPANLKESFDAYMRDKYLRWYWEESSFKELVKTWEAGWELQDYPREYKDYAAQALFKIGTPEALGFLYGLGGCRELYTIYDYLRALSETFLGKYCGQRLQYLYNPSMIVAINPPPTPSPLATEISDPFALPTPTKVENKLGAVLENLEYELNKYGVKIKPRTPEEIAKIIQGKISEFIKNPGYAVYFDKGELPGKIGSKDFIEVRGGFFRQALELYIYSLKYPEEFSQAAGINVYKLNELAKEYFHPGFIPSPEEISKRRDDFTKKYGVYLTKGELPLRETIRKAFLKETLCLYVQMVTTHSSLFSPELSKNLTTIVSNHYPNFIVQPVAYENLIIPSLQEHKDSPFGTAPPVLGPPAHTPYGIFS